MLNDKEAIQNISANIRFLLRERNWTQTRLHEITSEPQMTISRIVNGKNMPGAGTLARIAEALATSVDWLLADHSKENRQAS